MRSSSLFVLALLMGITGCSENTQPSSSIDPSTVRSGGGRSPEEDGSPNSRWHTAISVVVVSRDADKRSRATAILAAALMHNADDVVSFIRMTPEDEHVQLYRFAAFEAARLGMTAKAEGIMSGSHLESGSLELSPGLIARLVAAKGDRPRAERPLARGGPLTTEASDRVHLASAWASWLEGESKDVDRFLAMVDDRELVAASHATWTPQVRRRALAVKSIPSDFLRLTLRRLLEGEDADEWRETMVGLVEAAADSGRHKEYVAAKQRLNAHLQRMSIHAPLAAGELALTMCAIQWQFGFPGDARQSRKWASQCIQNSRDQLAPTSLCRELMVYTDTLISGRSVVNGVVSECRVASPSGIPVGLLELIAVALAERGDGDAAFDLYHQLSTSRARAGFLCGFARGRVDAHLGSEYRKGRDH